MYSYNESLYQDHPAQITTAGHQATPSRPWSKHWIGSRATAPGPSHVPFATSRHGARPFFFCHTKKKTTSGYEFGEFRHQNVVFMGHPIFQPQLASCVFARPPGCQDGNRLVRSDRLPGVHRLAPHRQHQGASAPKSEKETQQLCEISTL